MKKTRRQPVLFLFFSVTTMVLSLFLALRGTNFATTPSTARAASNDFVVFADALAANWQNWSWSSNINFAQSTPTHSGSAAIGVGYTAAWAGLSLRAPSPIDANLYQAVSFWVHGGSAGTRQLRIVVQQNDNGGDSSPYDFDAPAGVWTQITVNLSALGNPATIARLNLADRSGTTQPAFSVDDIALVAKAAAAGISGTIQINPSALITPIDRRILGTNLPTWLGQSNFENATLRARTSAAGVSVIRMPGGSYGNYYGWLSCEQRANQANALPCGTGWESWVARPTDFVNFLKATGTAGMWVVSPNGTAKEAAAVVAFFNAAVTDTTVIGVDSKGFNWQNAGYWAQLRSSHGNPNPLGIKLWAFGNEIYGSKPATGGAQCAAWGWEDLWTCDGSEYVNGANGHEGYTAFRNAMRAIDPTIQFGAVGVPVSNDWNNWGNEVLAAAGATMDFYDIHEYAYFTPPATLAEALAKPQTSWRTIMNDVRSAITTQANGRAIPIAFTEYNLFSVQDQDNGQLMTRMVDALFIADSLGQQMQQGVAMANQWDLANGRAGNGTEYGLMHADNQWFRSPQYYVFPLWSRFGSQMLSVHSSLNAATEMSVYAGRVDSSTLSLLAINKTSAIVTGTISINGVAITGGLLDQVTAASLSAQSVLFNNNANPADNLSNAPSLALNASGASIQVAFPANSLSLLRLSTQSATPPSAPSNLSAISAASTQINLAWVDTANNETGFKIERCEGAGCSNFSQIASVGSNITTFQNSGLTAGVSYTYRVRATNGAGDSAYANHATAVTVSTPAAPNPLTATTVSNVQISLAWGDNSTNESGFKIERCQGISCTTFVEIFTTTANIRSYANTSLLADTTYCYRLRAYNGSGNSSYSNSACRTTAPVAPLTLTANRILSGEVNLFWVESSTNETGFKLQRCIGITCTNFVQIALLPANVIGYHDGSLVANTSYRYRVAAYNANGTSNYSNILTITTAATMVAAQVAPQLAAQIGAVTSEEVAAGADAGAGILPLGQLPLAHTVLCFNNAQPTQVTLWVGESSFPMSASAEQPHLYSVSVDTQTQFSQAMDYLVQVRWGCAGSAEELADYIGLLQGEAATLQTLSPTEPTELNSESSVRVYLPVIEQ